VAGVWVVLAWPSGSGAVFQGSNGSIAYDAQGSNGQVGIWTVNPDGSGVQEVRSEANAADDDPVFSSDGQRIAFVNGSGHIVVMDADGNNAKDLTPNDAPGGVVDGSPSWSPDGTKIAFSRINFDRASPEYDIWVLNATDGSGQQNLTAGAGIDSIEPTFSPNGSKIAFVRGNPEEVWTMGSNGSAPTQLSHTDFDASDPSWSPDGSRLVFSFQDTDLYLIDSNGSSQTQLTNTSAVAEGASSWSPDGTKIVTRGQDSSTGANNLYLVNPTNGAETRVPNTTGADHPDWQAGRSCGAQSGSLSYTFSVSTQAQDAGPHDTTGNPHVTASGGCCRPSNGSETVDASGFSTGGGGPASVVFTVSFVGCSGQSYSTTSGPGLVVLKYGDGSSLTLAQQSGATSDACTSPRRHRLCFSSLRGHLYALTRGGAAGSLQAKSGRAVVQIHGGAVTLDSSRDGLLAHLIEGSGSVRIAGRTVHLSAGQGVLVAGKSSHVTDRWPSRDHSLVPAAQEPPRITGLRVTSGKSLRVRLRLNRKVRLRVRLLRSGRTVETANADGRAGLNRVKLRAPAQGHYVLQVFAVDRHGRGASAQRTVKVR
jgi:Tol biopolymer transport system component